MRWTLVLLFTFTLFLTVALAESESETTILSEVKLVKTGVTHFLRFKNQPIFNFYYLWSYISIEITSSPDGPFEVLFSNNRESIYKALEDKNLFGNQVGQINCLYFFESKSKMNKCSFDITYYGEPIQWWIPRYDNLFEETETVIGIYNPHSESSSNYSSGGKTFQITAIEQTTWKKSLSLILIGILLYNLSPYISRSRNFYLLMWFILGSFLGVAVLLIIALYFIGKQFNSGISVSSLAVFVAAGWSSLYFTNIIPYSANDLLVNPLWLGFMGFGGFIGVFYGFVNELTPNIVAKTNFFFRSISLILLFWAFYQTEAGVFFVILFLLVNQFSFKKLIKFGPVRYTNYITREQYKREGVVYTKKELASLVEAVKAEPTLLTKLSEQARSRLLKMTDDKHLTMLFESMDIDPVDDGLEEDEIITDSHFEDDE